MRICDETGEVDCAAYEPTGRFRDVVRQLQDGDLVRAYGGTRAGSKLHRITINLEKLEIIQLAPRVELRNPLCDSCGKRMKSEGRNQGFQCEGCGARKPPGKTRTITSRNLSLGLYIPPPRAHRHLTKPESRYGKEKSISATRPIRLIPCWHNP
jgi:tRNA(Ile2)-agmatinylcytidine synthase